LDTKIFITVIGMDKTLLRSSPYYEQVYDQLKTMIIQGKFAPGERIYEAKIAEGFRVSRSPVREAIRVLVREGLLVVRNKQITVYQPTLRDVEEIYQCRMALESLAARLASGTASDKELEKIESVLEQTKEMIEGGEEENKEQIVCLNTRFHDLIIECSKNLRLQQQLEHLRSLSYFYRVLNSQGAGRARVILEEHREIFAQIRSRREEEAARLMERHITNDLRHLKKILLEKNFA
jgi:DNA-binding GntR family transcriptional regulator